MGRGFLDSIRVAPRHLSKRASHDRQPGNDAMAKATRQLYQVRNGSPSFRKIREIYEVDGTSITRIELDTNDMAIMRFQVNDLGSTEGLTLLGANQMIYA